MQALVSLLQQYSGAVTLLGGTDYLSLSRFSQLLAGTEPGHREMISAKKVANEKWKVLESLAVSSGALCAKLQETSATLQLERVDAALAAEEAKQQAAAAVGAATPQNILSAVAALTSAQAAAAHHMALHISPGTEVIDDLQQLVLGYATVLIVVRDAVAAVNSGGAAVAAALSERTAWLAEAVQTADGVGALAGELQLLGPSLAGLLAAEADRETLEAELEGIQASLEGFVSSREGKRGEHLDAEVPAVAGSLLDISVRFPIVASLLQCVQGVHAAVGAQFDGVHQAPSHLDHGPALATVVAVVAKSGGDDLDHTSIESLYVIAALLDLWEELSSAWDADTELKEGPEPGLGVKISGAWERMSHVLAAFVAEAVQMHALPKLAHELLQTAESLTAIAPALGKEAGGDPLPAASPLDEEVAPSFMPASPPAALPSFFDLGGDATFGEEDGLGGILEPDALHECLGGLEESGADNEGGSHDAATEHGHSATQELSQTLLACQEVCGAVAAIDSARYVADLVVQQAQPQAARYQAEVAAHQWRFEPLLDDLPESAPRHSAPGSTGAGPQLLQVEALSRRQILLSLQRAVAALQEAQSSATAWAQNAAAVQHSFSQQLAQQAPYAANNVYAVLGAAAEWHADSARHAATLLQLAETVLDFEACREWDHQAAVVTGAVSPSTVALQRCAGASEKVNALRAALSEKQNELQEAQVAMERLQQSMADSAETINRAVQGEAAATAKFNKVALPLIKALQRFGPSIKESSSSVGVQFRDCAIGIATVHRRLARLQLVARGDGAELVSGLMKGFDALLTCMHELPAAVAELSAIVQRITRELAQGGRGEVVARAQALQIVDALEAPMEALCPLVSGFQTVFNGLLMLLDFYTSFALK